MSREARTRTSSSCSQSRRADLYATSRCIAWLAGLLEGEGSFKKPAPSAPHLPIVTVQMTDEDVIARAARLVGVGYCSVIPKNPRHQPTFVMSAKETRARDLMLALRPLMGQRRRGQIDQAVAASPWRRGDGPKLTLAQAREVKTQFAAGEAAVDLAAEFGISKWLVYRIKEGKRAA